MEKIIEPERFNDLRKQFGEIKPLIEDRIDDVLTHGQFINGPEVSELETTLAKYNDTKYAVGCASGTDALRITLETLNIGPGHAVITTPFTFIATAEVILSVGATPVFADIDPTTYNINPQKILGAAKRANKAGLVVKALMPVDLFGLSVNHEELLTYAKSKGWFYIGDCCQSFGAEYKGRKSIAMYDVACTSFFPTKPLGCYGDGGMVFTNNDEFVDGFKSRCSHGKSNSFPQNKLYNIIGTNSRLDTIQAAVLLAKFSIFSKELEFKQEIAFNYSKLLLNHIHTLRVPDDYISSWAQYPIRCQSNGHRENIKDMLTEHNLPYQIHYQLPLSKQPLFNLEKTNVPNPISDIVSSTILCLPMYPYLPYSVLKKICNCVNSASLVREGYDE